MSDAVSVARSARESLAQGLAALQGHGVPAELQAAAEPVAEAMSALHRIEVTHGADTPASAPTALAAVRRALAMLQTHPGGNAFVDQAVEAIAGSLGLVHTLHQLGQAGFVSMVPPTQPSAPGLDLAQARAEPAEPAWQTPHPQAWQPKAAQPAWEQQQPPAAPAWSPAPQQSFQQEPSPPQAAQPAWQNPEPRQEWHGQAPQPAYAPSPAQQGYAAAPQGGYAQGGYGQAPPQGGYGQAPAGAAYGQPPPGYAQPAQAAWQPTGGANRKQPLRIDAELGAHSASNFYKGLSGNDVIDAGGIFVATYQIPEVGQDLIVRVSLPGGYEFEAMAIVKWTRDAPESGADAPPGFGAQFTQISPEGRQLVYRYVRNREPLFHDDL